MSAIEPLRTPARSASTLVVRFSPTRPPTPFRLNPNPSSTGGRNVTSMITNRLNPPGNGEPSAFLVWIKPIAVSDNDSSASSSIPAYCPWSLSKATNPPPVTGPASIVRPAPSGGRKPRETAALPRFPAPDWPPTTCTFTPTPVTFADSGPRDKPADRPMTKPPLPDPAPSPLSAIWALSI